jgi:hypothetical protein
VETTITGQVEKTDFRVETPLCAVRTTNQGMTMSGSMSVGGATVALVESGGGMQVEAFNTRLEMVLAVIDNGAIGRPGGGFGYGSDGHKAALDAVEKQVERTRASIAAQEAHGCEDSDA